LAAYAKEDQEFHEFIMEIAGGEVFSSVFKAYAIVIFTYHADLPGGFLRHPKETIQKHLNMIEAVCNRDEEKSGKTHASPHETGERKVHKKIRKGGAKDSVGSGFSGGHYRSQGDISFKTGWQSYRSFIIAPETKKEVL
jgi:hypothetical protein